MAGTSWDFPAIPSSIPLLQIKDVTFAILNYTYGPNLGTLPAELRGHLNMLCAYNEKTGAIDFTSLNPQVLEDIRNAGELADIVIVCPHWGTEYQDKPSSCQKTFAEQMTEAGAARQDTAPDRFFIRFRLLHHTIFFGSLCLQ